MVSIRILFLVFLIINPFVFSCGRKTEASYKWAEVKKGDIKEVVYVTGVVKPKVGAEVKVGSRVSGRVEKLFVREGDWVNKGDMIAIIEHEDLEAMVKEAEAELDTLKRELKLIMEQYPLQIKEQEAENSAIRAKLEYSKKQLERYRELRKKDFVSQEEVDRWEREVKTLRAELEAGIKRVEYLKAKMRNEIAIKKAKIRKAEELLKIRRINLSYAFIKAPISGIVTEVSTQEGETVAASLAAPTFVVVVDPTKLEVYAYVDESEIGKVRSNQKVTLTVDAYPDLVFKGRVRKINPKAVIRENMVNYEAIVELDEPLEKLKLLRPEMTAYVKIIVGERKGVLIVPSKAVKLEGGRNVVYVKGEKGVERRFVTVGISEEGRVEIKKGLKLGEKVLVEGFGTI